jgi:hypothetical protein
MFWLLKYFYVDCIFKSRMHYKKQIVADGYADRDPASAWTLENVFLKFWTSIFGGEMIALWIFISPWIDIKNRIIFQKTIQETSCCFSLADGNVDEGPMSAQTLGYLFLNMWTSISGREIIGYWCLFFSLISI